MAYQDPYSQQTPYAQQQQQGMYGQPGQYGYQAPALQYVSVWPRCGAIIIDSILVGIVNYIVELALHYSTLSVILAIIISFGYFCVMEATQGRTLGKMALGLKVVREDGSPISWNEAIIRNLMRIVDEIPYIIPYLLAAIMVWSSPTRQRLGDKVAKTVVVRAR